jgi:hypothetical protein
MHTERSLPRCSRDPLRHLDARFEPFDPLFDADPAEVALNLWADADEVQARDEDDESDADAEPLAVSIE